MITMMRGIYRKYSTTTLHYIVDNICNYSTIDFLTLFSVKNMLNLHVYDSAVCGWWNQLNLTSKPHLIIQRSF